MLKSATLSADLKYRYRLQRDVGAGGTRVTFICLNPSTADANIDDPTVRRCIGFAKLWGFDIMEIVNLFAFRATDPSKLRKQADPVGPSNDKHIAEAADLADLVVAAWGNPGAFMDRAQYVRGKISPLFCLGINQDGSPKHPLYLKKDTPIQVYPL